MDKDHKMKFDYHIHTDITDGEMTIMEIIEEARKIGLKKIAITEHISGKPTYDWFKFKNSIKKIKTKGIKILVGVETKVLNENGDLDVSEEVLNEADIVLGSLHGEGDVRWLLNSKCDIIAHPQITSENIKDFIGCNKIIEISAKYRLPKELLDKLIKNGKNVFSFGSDSHCKGQIIEGQEYFEEIIAQYPNIKFMERIK